MKLKLVIIVLMLVLAVSYPVRGQPEKTRLLPKNAYPYSASWSPDGRWIAFAITGKPPEQAASGLYIVTPVGTEVATITEGITPGDFVSYSYWSPDSNYIRFTAGSVGTLDHQTIIVSANGNVISQFESDLSDVIFNPWRSDSRAYFKVDEPTSQIVAIGLDGKEIMRSTDVLISMTVPEVSPNGKMFAIATEQELVVLDSLTLQPLAKYLENEILGGFSWSPDNKLLLAVVLGSDQISGQSLVLDLSGKQLGSFAVTANLFNVQWSPDSTTLALVNKPGKTSKVDVTFYNIDGKVLGKVPIGSEFSEWGPDNTYTTLTTNGELVAIQSDGTIAYDFRFKTFPVGSTFAPPMSSWSPDGKLFALAPSPSAPCCTKELRIYGAGGKLLRTLERDEIEGNGNFYWSPDSSAIVLFEGKAGVWIVKV